MHGTYLQDWLRAGDANWRVDEQLGGASRAFADIGSHWCDLAEFVSGHRIERVSARLLTAVPERASEPGHAFATAAGGGELRQVTTEDAALVQFETDAGAVGSVVISQISAGRKNRLWIELDGTEEALAFDQEHPEELWCGRREALTIVRGIRPRCPLPRRASRRYPPATRRAMPTASTRSWRTSTRNRRRLDDRRNADVLRRAACRADHRSRAGLRS